MADIFDVVADATRRDILRVLLDSTALAGDGSGESSVSEIVAVLGLSQPTVSKHLKVLREAGLVAVREKGQRRFYRLDATPLGQVSAWLEPFVGAGSERVEQAAALPEGVQRFAARLGRVAAEAGHRVTTVVGKATGASA